MKSLLIGVLLVLLYAAASAAGPDCASADRWPTSMAFVYLKNAGITDNDKVDFSKTTVVRLASEKIATDVFRQLHDVTFTEKSGRRIEVITISDASREECSLGGVAVFVVTQHLGDHSVEQKSAGHDGQDD